MSTTIQTNGIVEVARYASDLTPISRVEESLVSIQTQAESFPEQLSDMIVPLEVERDALAKAWEDLKTSLKEQGKEDKYFDSVPGDFNSLVQTARTAQKELLTKKGRKPKEYFNKFCEKAWAHKTVLDFFPSSNEYVAVFCGVIKTLVKASVNYTTITEGFAQALDEITEHVDFAKRQVVNMPSSHTISALASLYKETFLYLKEFTEWFTKKTRRRLLKAFDGNIYDKYKEQIDRIRRSSQNVYQVVMVETIQNMQRSRPTDETLEQELENLWNKFNATIQFRETGIRATGMLEGVYRSEQWQQGQLLLQQQLLPDEPTVELQKGLPVTLQSSKQEGAGQYTRTSLITSADTLETFIMGNSTELLKALPPSPFATIPVAIKIQEWLASKESAMLWAHGLPTYGYPTGFSALAGSLINAALASDNKVIFHFCEPPQSNQLSEGLTLEQAGMISMVYSLIRQLVKLLPAELTIETDLSSDRFMELQSPMNGWNSAIEILERLLELSPPVLICVIDGLSDLDYDQGAPLFQDFLGVLKRRGERARLNGHFLKCLFTSNGFSKTLDENLGEEQIVSDLEPPLAPGTFGYAGPGQRYIETSNWGGDGP